MKDYKIRAEAAEELIDAATWYEQEAAPGFGSDLIAKFEARLEQALRFPGVGTIVATTSAGTPIRRYRLERYAILLAEIDGEPTVLAFECSSRRPGYWQDRLE